MVRSETAGRQEDSGGIFREHDSLFRSPEETGGTERYRVSGANDPAEVRAERTADAVTGGGIFREAGGPGAEGGQADLSPADLSGPGDALPSDLQQSMGASMGADFSDVRIHTGPGADRANEQLSARAFTRGKDVYFQSGAYDPGSREGRHLIAHELAHVAQDGGGIHREFDEEKLKKPTEVTEEQLSDMAAFITAEIEKITVDSAMEEKIQNLKAKYIDKTAAIEDNKIGDDLDVIRGWNKLASDGDFILGYLRSGANNTGITIDKVKQAYEAQAQRMQDAIEQFKEKVNPLRDSVMEEETAAMEGGTVGKDVKLMLNDPAFKEFKKAVSSMQLLGKDFADVDKAAFKSAKENVTLGKEGGEISLREKQEAMNFHVTRPDEESGAGKAARVLKAGGDAAGGVGESAADIADTSTSHHGERKNKDEKETEKKAKAFAGATNSLLGAVGSGLSGMGDAMSAHDAKKRAELEDAKGAKAQKNMKNIGLQLERTIPGVTAQRPAGQSGDDPQARSRLVRKVCDYVKQDKPSEKDSLTGLIDAALKENAPAAQSAPASGANAAPATGTSAAPAPAALKPDLTERQRNLLLSLKTIEAGRSGSAAKAGRLKQESIFSSLDAVGNFMKAIGGLTSGISGFADSTGWQVAGAVISAVGAIFGAASAMAREAKAPKVNEDDERAKKVETSRAFMSQMAALPVVDETSWDDMFKIANPPQPSGGTAAPVPKISRENAFGAEQYAAVFFGIQASNVELADLIFAIKRGGFHKAAQTGDGDAQKAEQDRLNREGMDALYANLAFS